ncbi:MAG: regulatory protein RecX [Candidatus Omnitrophica bacterium]|nr:regulatory protein RecX [Candidatus Omnitrophota bacterium]
MKSRRTELELEGAKSYAFLLLKFRQRSQKELYLRLKRKKFPEDIIYKVISFLVQKEFIDDKVFARSWLRSRLKRPFGLRRIKEELKFKGIDKEIIEDELALVKKDYREEDVVGKIARQRLEKLKNIDPAKARQRVYAYLLRRGFSPEVVSEAIKQ